MNLNNHFYLIFGIIMIEVIIIIQNTIIYYILQG